MIEVVKGNLLDAQVDALVNAVNCVGAMGRGIALQFAKAFPQNAKLYQQACKQGRVSPGHVLTVPNEGLNGPRYIVNFPTKRHWKFRSRLEYIESGLASLTSEVQRMKICSIAIPPLGCGLGGLDWSDVRPLIEAAMSDLPHVHTLLYELAAYPDPQCTASRRRGLKVTPASR